MRNADSLGQHLIAWNNKRSITRKLVLMVQRVERRLLRLAKHHR